MQREIRCDGEKQVRHQAESDRFFDTGYKIVYVILTQLGCVREVS